MPELDVFIHPHGEAGRGLLNVYELKPDGTLLAQELAFVYVQYPYRKTKDLYLSMKDRAVRCIQCGEDVVGTDPEAEEESRTIGLIAHVRGHDRRKTIRALAARTPLDGGRQ